MNTTKANFIFYSGLILAIWFAVTGLLWTYWAALFISYPFGLISLGLWSWGRKIDQKPHRYRIVSTILSIGFICSMAMLVGMLIFDQ